MQYTNAFIYVYNYNVHKYPDFIILSIFRSTQKTDYSNEILCIYNALILSQLVHMHNLRRAIASGSVRLHPTTERTRVNATWNEIHSTCVDLPPFTSAPAATLPAWEGSRCKFCCCKLFTGWFIGLCFCLLLCLFVWEESFIHRHPFVVK